MASPWRAGDRRENRLHFCKWLAARCAQLRRLRAWCMPASFARTTRPWIATAWARTLWPH